MIESDEIRKEIERGYRERNMTARFNLLVLLNADEVEEMGTEAFCRLAGVKESYMTNAADMLALSRIMKQKRLIIIERTKAVV